MNTINSDRYLPLCRPGDLFLGMLALTGNSVLALKIAASGTFKSSNGGANARFVFAQKHHAFAPIARNHLGDIDFVFAMPLIAASPEAFVRATAREVVQVVKCAFRVLDFDTAIVVQPEPIALADGVGQRQFVVDVAHLEA